jgi:hypothetical protein
MRLTALSVALLLVAGSGVAFADDLDDSLAALKQAQPTKDVAKIKQYAAEVHAAAKKLQGPPPPEVADKDAYAARQSYAKEVDTYSEYALFALALEEQARPATAMDLIETLEKQNPKSKYLSEPEVLQIQADNALAKNQSERALSMANRLIAVCNGKEPEGEANWPARKDAALGHGYWIAGVIQGQKSLFKDSDRNLRAALPLIKGNNAMLGPALFFLGVDNYNIGKLTLNKAKVLEGAKFSQESANIPGPYQNQAYHNSMTIKDEAARMR